MKWLFVVCKKKKIHFKVPPSKLRWMCMYRIRSTFCQMQTYFHNTFNVSSIKICLVILILEVGFTNELTFYD